MKSLKLNSKNLLLSFSFFLLGILVGHNLSFAKNILNIFFQHEKSIADVAFTDPLIQSQKLFDPIKNPEDIFIYNERIFLNSEDFFNAYENIAIVNVEKKLLDSKKTSVLKLTFVLEDKKYTTYAYFISQKDNNSSSSLVIPGSGQNESTSIYLQDKSNYHYGIVEALQNTDTYIYIKPNEGIRAYHNGKNKLSYNFIVNWHINHGGSYSASYIVETLALTKYLKNEYKDVVVAGLSQGGGAALVNSLQSKPNKAIVSSGYSILTEKLEWAGHKQILIPEYSSEYTTSTIKQKIENSTSTKFLFTYGKKEQGIYGEEAEKKHTCHFLEKVSNATCIIHNEGHVFPVTVIKDFIKI